ncbi:MAG: AI-2E family transporter [Archangium sp.]|nr:AI-2E family transporter [Archangium sp.]MDP3572542.1 AI-2E family transporter [Archangium sp.]
MNPLRWLLLVLCAASLFVIWPLWPPLLLAAWTAALARPLLVRLENGLKGRRRAAAVLSLLIFVVLALPLALVGVGVITGAQELFATVKASPSATVALQTLLSSPDAPQALPTTLADLAALTQRSGAQGFGFLSDLAGAAATAVVGLFIYFAGAYALLVDSTSVWAWIKLNSPLQPAHLDRLADAFHETGRGLLVGVGLTTATQGLAAMIIYFALGVPRAWVLGPITGIASVIPMVGSALVWGPISLGLFLTDHPIKALILVGLGIGVISVIDNLLRPIYARMGALKMPMFLLLLSVFGGLAAFGTWGALIGPLIVRLAIEVLAIVQEEKQVVPA